MGRERVILHLLPIHEALLGSDNNRKKKKNANILCFFFRAHCKESMKSIEYQQLFVMMHCYIG
ncbi:MAG: hypothetical protein AMK74_06700 [Nitrospira bacterium SM23_35]|nr:MAG: hypothetical protein AMK74_06700 [Nitrospira bacterium SM23_35]